jgi:hypothetical protein
MRSVACVVAALAVLVTTGASAETQVLERGYADAGLTVWVPQGELARHDATTTGWSLQFGAGPKRLPLMLGLGAGALRTASRSDAGPRGVWVHDDTTDFGPTTVLNTVELRHVELILRLEPDWPRVRPFLEGTAGFCQYWTTTTMSADWTGGVVGGGESAADYAPAFGLGGGLIVSPLRPLRVAPGADGTGGGELALALTLGVRLVRGGGLAVATPLTPDGASTTLAPARAALDAVAPYASLTVNFRATDGR